MKLLLLIFSIFMMSTQLNALCSDSNNENQCTSNPSGCIWDNKGTNAGNDDTCVDAANTPPTANAGSDQTVAVGSDITLDGSGSTDSDGTIDSYSWSDGTTTWTGVAPTISTTGWSTGDYTITLTVTDNDGATDTDTVVVTVIAAGNTPPTFTSTPVTTATEGTAYSYTVSTNDADDGDTVTVTASTLPSWLSFNGTVLIGTPATGDAGLDNIVLTADDGTDTTDQTFTITVSAAGNSDPVANDKNYTAPFETAISGNVITDSPADSDPDGDTLTISSFTSPAHGTLTIISNGGDGNFTYTPNNGYSGLESFTYSISDSNGGIDTATVIIKINSDSGIPSYDNSSVCGLFGNVLTTYDHLTSNGNNDQVCNTESIAYPEGEIDGEIICHEDPACGGDGQSCERVDPPNNRYAHDFPDNNLSGSTSTLASSPVTLQGFNYGDINYGGTITLDPQTTYDGSSIKVMLLGHMFLSSATLKLEPGDYYFDSLTFDGQNNTLILPNGGPVRIFIKGNLEVDMNNLSFNADTGSSENDLFVYVAGNFESIGNGGGTTSWKAFIYVEGTVELNNNSNNWQIYGAITAEGEVTIDGNNPDFIGTGDGSNLGVGECVLCFEQPHSNGNKVSTTFANEGAVTITDLIIRKAYAPTYSPYTKYAHSVTTGTSATVSVTTDIENLPHFPNPTTVDGFEYTIGNYNADQRDTVTDTTTVPFNLRDYNTSTLADAKALYLANYTEGGYNYHEMVNRCSPFTPETTYLTGPFDAWDTFRNINDRNISTKIAAKPYEITIASLNAEQSATELKAGIDITYSLVDKDTNVKVAGPFPFNAAALASINTSAPFPVPTAHKRVGVEFEVCADYNGTAYTFYSHGDLQCSGGNALPPVQADTAPGDVRYRLFYASDLFAIRPDSFVITFNTSGELTSGIEYNLTVQALDAGGASTVNYNQDSADITKTSNLYLKDNSPDTGLMDGNSTFTDAIFIDGVDTIPVSFDNVGQVGIHFEDTNWAMIDADDSPSNCNDTHTFNGYSNEAGLEDACFDGEGALTTFIPDHFRVDGITLTNHRGGYFTYLSNDLNMSAHVAVNITAENAAGATTTNFDANPQLYGNPVTVDLNVTDWNATLVTSLTTADTTNRHPFGQPLKVKDINTASSLGFSAGTITSNALMFNYTRTNNPPNIPLPFVVPGSDVNVTVDSTYTPSTVSGSGAGTGTGAAKFFYARAKSEKGNDYYDDVTISTTINTPIQVLIYCQTDTCLEAGPFVTITDTPSQWWIIEDHDQTLNDGNISLQLNPAVAGAAVNPSDPNQVIISASSPNATIN